MSNLLLEGQVDHSAEQIRQLKEQVHDLRQQLTMAIHERDQARKGIARAVATLRQLLLPYYRTMQVIMGEIEEAGIDNAPAADARWEPIKKRLPPRLRECVELLLAQGSMKRKEIAAAMHMNYTGCVNNVIGRLVREGLVVDNGGKMELKEL